MLASEIQALSGAGGWAESFARLAHGTGITYCNVSTQTDTIVSNVSAAHTRLSQHKRTRSGRSLTFSGVFGPCQRDPSLVFCMNLDSALDGTVSCHGQL